MALGRGLNSLIPPKKSAQDFSAPTVNPAETSGLSVIQIPVTDIVPNPHQPRLHFSHAALEELIQSIKEHGILQPLLVSRGEEGYELIAGERRLRAARIAGLETVPAIVRNVDDLEKLELAMIENIQRSDLNPIEKAEGYNKLLTEFGLNHDEAAKKMGMSRSTFSNAIRLLDLPGDVQKALADGMISEGHAKILLGLPTAAEQMKYWQLIISEKLSVHSLAELLTGKTKQVHHTTIVRTTMPAHVQAWQEDLALHLGTKVKIDEKALTIKYYSLEELGEIVKKILKR